MQDLLFSIMFYGFAFIAVISALMVIIQKNPVRGVLFLVVTFLASSGVWMLLHSEFLSLILILVYVGAVMTLFLFVVMMLNIDIEVEKHRLARFWPLILLVVAAFAIFLFQNLPQMAFKTNATNLISNTESLGLILYTDYMLVFEIAALILLVAIIAAISLTHIETKNIKRQKISEQVLTKKSDRLQLVNIRGKK